MTNVTCGSVTMRNGLAGRSCVYTGRGSMNMNKFVDPFSVIVTAQGWAGGSSLDGQVAGGLSERVTVTARSEWSLLRNEAARPGKLTTRPSVSNEGTYGYFGAFGSATPALAGYGGVSRREETLLIDAADRLPTSRHRIKEESRSTPTLLAEVAPTMLLSWA